MWRSAKLTTNHLHACFIVCLCMQLIVYCCLLLQPTMFLYGLKICNRNSLNANYYSKLWSLKARRWKTNLSDWIFQSDTGNHCQYNNAVAFSHCWYISHKLDWQWISIGRRFRQKSKLKNQNIIPIVSELLRLQTVLWGLK